jgi:hypothetical protein
VSAANITTKIIAASKIRIMSLITATSSQSQMTDNGQNDHDKNHNQKNPY